MQSFGDFFGPNQSKFRRSDTSLSLKIKEIHTEFFRRNQRNSHRSNTISPAKEMGGGTEAFPDLGRHCQKSDCNQLDFLPFTCNACRKAFCLEHRSSKSHDCPKPDSCSRKVVVCEACSAAVETTGCDRDGEKRIMERHEKSGDCDPTKKKKPKCPVPRCKEVLTFSNTAACKTCRVKTCLKHRFPADHACRQLKLSSNSTASSNKFLVALAARTAKDCGKNIAASTSQPSVKAY